jgi:hypothetical protein
MSIIVAWIFDIAGVIGACIDKSIRGCLANREESKHHFRIVFPVALQIVVLADIDQLDIFNLGIMIHTKCLFRVIE